MFEIAPGHHTPDSLRGRAKPLSLSRALTTPPRPPKIEIREAHTHGFMSSPPTKGAPSTSEDWDFWQDYFTNTKGNFIHLFAKFKVENFRW
jgi:hypothetical protein